MLAGGHMIEQVFGVLDAVMTISYEKFIIDQELISRAIRICEGVDTSDAALSLEVMQEIGPGGRYPLHQNTFEKFRSQWLPSISFWGSYAKWEENGRENILTRANRKYKEILASRPQMMIPPDLDRDLKFYLKKVRGL